MKVKQRNVWRYIPFGIYSGAQNMAIDETLLNAVINADSPNAIRFYKWLPSTASIGVHQSLSSEINQQAAQAQNVDLVRRISGGGAVLHDSIGEITYAIICRLKDLPKFTKSSRIYNESISPRYQVILEAIAKGLEQLGLTIDVGKIHCPALFTEGKKISGNAQIIRKNVLLQHGTILLKVFPEKMYKILKAPKGVTYSRMVQSVRTKVTGILQGSDFLKKNKSLSDEKIINSLKKGFEDVFHISLKHMNITFSEKEEKEINNLIINKYTTKKWLQKYP